MPSDRVHSPGGWNNLGNALHAAGRFDEAARCYERALALRPDHPEAHLNRGISLLLRGELRRGFDEYEWRFRCARNRAHRRHFTFPQWDGRPLRRRTILLHAEQGLGDAIQFVRYVPLVAARAAGRIILECRAELMSLLKRVDGVDRVIERKRLPDDEPIDLHAPLLSLPRIFRTTPAAIPYAVPYVSADPARSRAWRERLARIGGATKVGLAWAGNPKHPDDANRSIDPRQLLPLTRISGVTFVSLQKDAHAGDIDAIDVSDQLRDFAETAAAVEQLDLVISVDTSVAHLAGAMGKPTWVMLPFVPDWRWMIGRDDSPWYPTARLFRQPRAEDWQSVVRDVAHELANLSLAAIPPLAA